MLQDIKTTSKHTIIYALGNIGLKMIGLILIPLYTNPKYLSHADYGVLAVLEATSQLLIGVLTMAMGTGLARWYWDAEHKTKQKSIFFSTVAFLILCSGLVASLLLLSSNYFSKLLFESNDYSYLLKLTIGAAAFQIINNQILALVRLQSRSIFFSAIQIAKLVLILGLILWGIKMKDRGLNAIWEANIIGEIIILIVLFPYALKNIQFKVHFKVLKEMLSYGLPLMLASVSGVLLATADRYMLSSMSSLENTGLYSLGFRIANTLKVLIAASISNALLPLNYKKMNDINNKRFYSKLNTYSIFIFIIALIVLCMFALDILKIFTKSQFYWEANGIIVIISFALLFGFLKDNMTIGLILKKRTKVLGILIFTTSLLNIALNLILIPFFDIYGAALSTLFSQFFFFILVSLAAQKAYHIPYEWKKVGMMIGVSVIIVLFGLSLAKFGLILRLSIKLLLLITFPYILYLFNFYERTEIENIKRIIINWTHPMKFKENIRRFLGR